MSKRCVVRTSDSTLNPQPLNPSASFLIYLLAGCSNGMKGSHPIANPMCVFSSLSLPFLHSLITSKAQTLQMFITSSHSIFHLLFPFDFFSST